MLTDFVLSSLTVTIRQMVDVMNMMPDAMKQKIIGCNSGCTSAVAT